MRDAGKTRIFISRHHTTFEDNFTARLEADLTAAGADVRTDDNSVTRDGFVQLIITSRAWRQCFLVVITPDAAGSPWVQREVNVALRERAAGRMLAVIPILLLPTAAEDVPPSWLELGYVDGTHGYEQTYHQLMTALGLRGPVLSERLEPVAPERQEPFTSGRPSPPATASNSTDSGWGADGGLPMSPGPTTWGGPEPLDPGEQLGQQPAQPPAPIPPEPPQPAVAASRPDAEQPAAQTPPDVEPLGDLWSQVDMQTAAGPDAPLPPDIPVDNTPNPADAPGDEPAGFEAQPDEAKSVEPSAPESPLPEPSTPEPPAPEPSAPEPPAQPTPAPEASTPEPPTPDFPLWEATPPPSWPELSGGGEPRAGEPPVTAPPPAPAPATEHAPAETARAREAKVVPTLDPEPSQPESPAEPPVMAPLTDRSTEQESAIKGDSVASDSNPLADAQSSPIDPKEVLSAFAEFVEAPDWGRSFEILEQRQHTLLSTQARLVLIQAVTEPDDKKMRQHLVMHLILLFIAAYESIAAARQVVEDNARQESQQQAQSGDADEDLIKAITSDAFISSSSSPEDSYSRLYRSSEADGIDRLLAHLSPGERAAVLNALMQVRDRDSSPSGKNEVDEVQDSDFIYNTSDVGESDRPAPTSPTPGGDRDPTHEHDRQEEAALPPEPSQPPAPPEPTPWNPPTPATPSTDPEGAPPYQPEPSLQTPSSGPAPWPGSTTGGRASGEPGPRQAPHVVSLEQVAFAAYHPKEVERFKPSPLLVYLALDDHAALAQVAALAAERLAGRLDQFRSGVAEQRMTLRRGAKLRIIPSIPGFHVNPQWVDVTWEDDAQQHEFTIRSESAPAGRSVDGDVCVYQGLTLRAKIPISIFVGQGAGASLADYASAVARAYRRVFASYSHRDTPVVESCEAAAEMMGDRYLRDVISLQSGQLWNSQLMKMITEADVFQLFWSKNAANSGYVRQEWEFALSLQATRPGFIRPVYWSTTPFAIPAALNPLHFEPLNLSALGWGPMRRLFYLMSAG